jgi:hypothetical protein
MFVLFPFIQAGGLVGWCDARRAGNKKARFASA